MEWIPSYSLILTSCASRPFTELLATFSSEGKGSPIQSPRQFLGVSFWFKKALASRHLSASLNQGRALPA